jgi:hypothetical protein
MRLLAPFLLIALSTCASPEPSIPPASAAALTGGEETGAGWARASRAPGPVLDATRAEDGRLEEPRSASRASSTAR